MKNTTLIYLILASIAVISCNSATENAPEKVSNGVLVEDPHSYAKPQEAVINHLFLDIEVDFENKAISGTATYNIDNKTGTDKIYFDTRDLEIISVVLDNGDETGFTLGTPEHHLGQPLIVDISPNTDRLSITYKTPPGAAALQWLDPVQTAGKKHPFLFTQSQAILARTWLPVQDGPGIRFSYNAKVKVPEGLMALMSAKNPMEISEDGVYHFEMNQPIPSYLMALAVGNLVFKPIGDRTGVYAEPEIIDKGEYELGEMQEMLELAEGLYGPYRWDRYDVIFLPPSFPFGGMENPRLTFATPTILAGDRSLTALIAHELAHSWSGNLVTNANWNDFWLNEGFTVYFEGRIMEALHGLSYANMLRQLGYQDLVEEIEDLNHNGQTNDTKLKLDLKGRDPDEGLTDVAYEKGALFLRHIENVTGRENFDNFLREYFKRNAFKVMTTEAFLEYLDAELIQGNEDWVKQINAVEWIYGNNLPEEHPIIKTDRFEKVEAELDKWVNGTEAGNLNSAEWTTHEWLHFLRHLPSTMSPGQMVGLDAAFSFTQSGNSEIAAVWLQHCIRNRYETAYPRLEDFLINVGRRKFLSPIYKTLMETEEGKMMALKIYEKARPNYHAVSYNSIDAILEQ